ncbi:MAG: NAD(+) diphosphatase [Pseudomonadota bacterium]
MKQTRRVTFSAGSGHLDRAAHLRDMSDDLMRHRRAALLPVFHGKILIDMEEQEPRLGWVPPLKTYVDDATEPPVFLGMSGETPCFAADFSAMEEHAAEQQFCDGAAFLELRTVATELGPASASIAATAKGILSWHAGNPFCAQCGARSIPESGGWRRICPECGSEHFPRTDPVVIMLILHDDEVLLGRHAEWPQGQYSLLAGFIEPGETVEDAVRRQVKEETGVTIAEVGYIGSQPWPFPNSLMLGCVGDAEDRDLTIDFAELEDAQWVSRAKMHVILAGKHPRMTPPRKDAIARAILEDWVSGNIRLP